MGNEYRKVIPLATKSHTTRKLERVFIDLNGKKAVGGTGGVKYILIACGDLTRFTWLYFFKNNSDVPKKFEEFLSDIPDHGKVEIVCSDNAVELFMGKEFIRICAHHRIKCGLTTAGNAAFYGVIEGALGHIEWITTAMCIHSPLMYSRAHIPITKGLWPEAIIGFGHAIRSTGGQQPLIRNTCLLTICGMGERYRLELSISSNPATIPSPVSRRRIFYVELEDTTSDQG